MNSAPGQYSFAAGRQAKALNDGSFVWADSTASDFSSTANNQFFVRAGGGIFLNAVSASLTLNGSSGIFLNGGSGGIALNTTGGVSVNNGSSINFGTQTRQMLNLYGTNYGIGVQGGDMYFRSVGSISQGYGFYWFGGGSHSDLGTDPGPGGITLMELNAAGQLAVAGSVTANFNFPSDRALKENLAPVDACSVLEKVAALPITEWQFKREPTVRHIGPMAQDFYAAFNVGPGDKQIAVVDEGGVALAAIQGLNQKLEESLKAKDAQISKLEAEMSELKSAQRQTMADWEARFSALQKTITHATDKSTGTLAAAPGEK